MSGISKLTNSFVTASNENTVALVNFHTDFALLKFEAPKEFNGLGTSLSNSRRFNAENGPLHKTLRKLGCLFEQIIPSTPRLIRVYGLRTSAIIQSPGINPKGSKSHGPFESFVGADGTSIWAAATSGASAMAVHLLVCMLARQFDDSKIGTAILVELVVERQREIQVAMENNHNITISSAIAARQDISREELAAFDASARSWLCSADEAKMSCQKRLMLILGNINVTVSGGSSTYTKVIDAWKQAMLGFEDLLGGMPQQISNGAILRALSAWHLYPDLIVLVNKAVNVRFEDPLLPEHGIVTVGLQSENHNLERGIQWSLTLSHLRFYGEPVPVKANESNSRVDMQQLHMIAFGSLLGSWNVAVYDIMDVALWFQTLWKTLQGAISEDIVTSTLPWLHTIVGTANVLIESQGHDLETFEHLVNYGRRRGGRFLSLPGECSRPFFGLGNPYTLAMVEANINDGIKHMREIAIKLDLKDYEAFIMYSETCADGVYHELATAIPHTRPSVKRLQDGSFKQEHVHARWITSELSFTTDSRPPCSCQTKCSRDCPCRCAGFFCGIACHNGGKRICQPRHLESRAKKLCDQGEETKFIKKAPIQGLHTKGNKPDGTTCGWPCPPTLFEHHNKSGCEVNMDMIGNNPDCCKCFETQKQLEPIFHRVAGHVEGFSLYIRDESYQNKRTPFFKAQVEDWENEQLAVITLLQYLSKIKKMPRRLFQYLRLISNGDPVSMNTLPKLSTLLHKGHTHQPAASTFGYIAEHATISPSILRSLRALSFANGVYGTVKTASTPLRIVEQPLHEHSWIPEGNSDQNGLWKQCSQAQAFACILTLESGGLRSEPRELESVMALSSGNSIFINGALLSDPTERAEGPDIRRVIGNVGKAGITVLISPQNLLVKPPDRDFRAATHAEYDGKRLDNFSGTSLHLSFTKWAIPINSGDYGLIDQDVFMAEAVISVRDCGRWIADIDVLGVRPQDYIISVNCKCSIFNKSFAGTYTSIDSWEELIDPPLSLGIFRAHENWAARLAAICILKQKNMDSRLVVLGQKNPCLTCLESQLWAEKNVSAFFID